MASPARVFVSYRHQEPDSTLAHTFADALKEAGYEVFIDTDIHWGADWVRQIPEVLAKADYLLFLLSREAAQSEMVLEEVLLARELAKRRKKAPIILPLRVCFPLTEPLPYHLSAQLRAVQQESWDRDEDTPRLVNQILALLERRTGWTGTADQEFAASVRYETPQHHIDPRDLLIPGGALDPQAQVYIPREADSDVLRAISQRGGLATIRGPRQAGKTSLLIRTCAAVRHPSPPHSPLRTVFVDFQGTPPQDFDSLNGVWHTIATTAAEQLRIYGWDDSQWKEDANYDRNLARFFHRFVFQEEEAPVLICLDELDRIFASPIRSEFFGSLRALHSRGAYETRWQRVRWLLSTIWDPSLFIEDHNQSPFNIGLRVELSMFHPDEVQKMAGHHGLTLDSSTLGEMIDYLGGHPYLTHLMTYHLAREPESREQLFDARTAGGGIFRAHLRGFLLRFHEERDLARAMGDIIKNRRCHDVGIVNRLEALGLVRYEGHQKVVPLCQLYADLFGHELN